LLDWLASEFVRLKWSQKALNRLIVTSATYRQDARVTPALLDKDAYNRLFARGPRFRMDAEMIRDVELAASGLLSPKIGGPSVFPVQPDGIWDNPYSDAKWVTSEGEDRYRRGLYTFARRTSPYPSFMTFDATSREFCTVRRVRTNTPLQALTLLNDEAFFEAARALGARALAEVSASATQAAASLEKTRAAYAFRLCTSRAPTEAEATRIVRSYEVQRAHYRAHQVDAARVLREPPGSGRAANLQAERAEHLDLFNLLGDPLLRLPYPREATIEVAPTATAGTLIVRNDKDEPWASMGYVAYVKKDGTARRPITFAFNGGPGSSSVWLHMGLLGPKRVQVPSDGQAAGKGKAGIAPMRAHTHYAAEEFQPGSPPRPFCHLDRSWPSNNTIASAGAGAPWLNDAAGLTIRGCGRSPS
jgi:hypothetical protein